MRTLLTLVAVSIAFFTADYAAAKPRDLQASQYHPHADKRFHNDRHGKRHRDVVRVDIPVFVRGDERLHLRRMLRRQGYNPAHYHLRKVVINNHGRRYASARLRVGDRVTHEQHLGRGKTHLRAPQQRYDSGRWVLGLNNARIDHVRIVLEPKRRWAYHNRSRGYDQPWFGDRRRAY